MQEATYSLSKAKGTETLLPTGTATGQGIKYWWQEGGGCLHVDATSCPEHFQEVKRSHLAEFHLLCDPGRSQSLFGC